MTLGRVLAALFNPAARRGLKGEVSVALGAALRLPSSTYARFHNLTLPVPDGTTQVDHSAAGPWTTTAAGASPRSRRTPSAPGLPAIPVR